MTTYFGENMPFSVAGPLYGRIAEDELYVCSKCGTPVPEEQVYDDASEAGDPVCKRCVEAMKEEEE